MADAEADDGGPTGLPAPDEDLIESEAPSSATTTFRRRLERLVPPVVGRKVVGGIAAAALLLGLAAGLLVGNNFGTEKEAAPRAQESASPPDGYIPIVPDGSSLEEDRVVVLSLSGALLTLQDLAGVGETTALPGSYGSVESAESDQLCGLSARAEPVPFPSEAGVEYTVFDSVSFVLAGASLTERIGPDLDVLSASTLRARIELARNCSSTGLTVSTEGVQTGIGDEYAVFTVQRRDPASGPLHSSILVLVRVGSQLVELTLTSEATAEVPDGLARALRIAEAAVMRMQAG